MSEVQSIFFSCPDQDFAMRPQHELLRSSLKLELRWRRQSAISVMALHWKLFLPDVKRLCRRLEAASNLPWSFGYVAHIKFPHWVHF